MRSHDKFMQTINADTVDDSRYTPSSRSLDSNMVTMRLYFWKFYSITSFNLASEWRVIEDSTNYPFVHQSMYPVFLGEKARHRRSPIELRSISLPLIRKINSLERRNLVPEEETRHARTHARARTAAARKKGREAKRSKAALSLLLEEPANEPQGFAQRLPGWQIAAGATIARLRSRESWRRVAFSILFLLEWLARMSCSRPPRRRVGQRSSFSNSTRLASPFLLSNYLSLSLSLASFESSLRTARISRNRWTSPPDLVSLEGTESRLFFIETFVQRLVRFRGNRIVDIFNAVRERSRLCEIRKRDFGE